MRVMRTNTRNNYSIPVGAKYATKDRATLPSPMPPQFHPERSLDDVLEDSAQVHTALGDREGALAALEKTQSLIDRTRAIVVQPSLRERCAEFARSVIRRRADSQVGENRSKSFEVSLIGGLVHKVIKRIGIIRRDP